MVLFIRLPFFSRINKPRGGEHPCGTGEAHKLHSRKSHRCLFPEGAEGSKELVKTSADFTCGRTTHAETPCPKVPLHMWQDHTFGDALRHPQDWALVFLFPTIRSGRAGQSKFALHRGYSTPSPRPLRGSVSDEHEDSQSGCSTSLTVKELMKHRKNALGF